jgi:hypothetical protein
MKQALEQHTKSKQARAAEQARCARRARCCTITRVALEKPSARAHVLHT